jgi:hypothetical protein
MVIALTLFSLLNGVVASSFNEPHSHSGVVTPFEPGDPNVDLDKKALNILGEGKPFQV